MSSRIVSALLAFALLFAPLAAQAQSGQSTLKGRVLDYSQGLAVPAAQVQLQRGDATVATTTTDANGVFTFTPQPAGEYSLFVTAQGYTASRVPTIFLVAGETVEIQTALLRSSNQTANMKEIARVVVAGRNALQTTTTINQSVDPSLIQGYAYPRAAEILGTLPGVNVNHTSASVGDDINISIRGFDSSEVATLLDGHPIGPIGSFSAFGGFNYKLSPFWGLSNINVIYGSGAAGIYGVSTIAGAVNFETLNPTRKPEFTLQQGVGNMDKALSGFSATGTLGKLGYALGAAVQGTVGQFAPSNVLQQANLTVGQYTDPNGITPPDSSPANQAANTYLVTGNYTQRNNLAKLVYQFSPRTQLLATATDWTTWNDKTGEGDNDYIPYGYALYQANNFLGQNFVLPNGTSTTCSSTTIAVVTASSGGNPTAYNCLTAQQYANQFAGPAGGGIGRWNSSHLQDYHARFTQQVGKTQFIADGFADNFNSDEHKSVAGPYFFDSYLSHGLLLSDEFELGKNNDFAFGWYTQHQRHDSMTTFAPNGTYSLTTSSYFVRDSWTPNVKFSVFGDLWEQYSYNTKQNNFDPRISFVYRPTGRDVIRVTGGRAYSEPDPQLVTATLPSLGAPQSLNPVCYPGALNGVGSVSNTNLRTETATDEEIAIGHRFNATTVVNLDVYNANEQNPILGGLEPLSAFPSGIALLNAPDPNNPAQTLLQSFLNRVQSQCGGTPTAAVLGWNANLNAGAAVYRGIDLTGTVGLVRNLGLDFEYGVQAASYQGIPVTVLQNNANLINGNQLSQTPLQKGNATLTYANPTGFRASMQGVYVGSNNWANRGAFWYANANIAQTTGPVTVSLGVANLFNSVAQQYGFIGYGLFRGQNQFGGATNALQAGTEQFGLPYREVMLNVTFKT